MSLIKRLSICLSVFLLCSLSLGLGRKISHEEGGLINYFKNLFSMHKIRPVRSYTLYGKTDGPVDFEAGLPDNIIPPKDFTDPKEYLQYLAFRQNLRNSAYVAASNQDSNGMQFNPGTTNSQPPFNRVAPTIMNNNNNEVQKNQILSQHYPVWYPNQGILAAAPSTGQVFPRQNDVSNNNRYQYQFQYLKPLSYSASPVAMNQEPQLNKYSLNWKQSSVRAVENPLPLNINVDRPQNVIGPESSSSTLLEADLIGNTDRNESSISGSSESEGNTVAFPLENDAQFQISYKDNNEIIDENEMESSSGNLAFDSIRYNINSDDDLLSTD